MLKPTQHARTNYRALSPYLAAVNRCGGHFRFTADGYMPLSIEALYTDDSGLPVYSMMHFTTQNGDLMRDPDMTFRVDESAGTIEPLTFQNDFMGMYQEVYVDDGKRYHPRLRTELDRFLWQWLKNISEQGYSPNEAPSPDVPHENPPFPSASIEEPDAFPQCSFPGI